MTKQQYKIHPQIKKLAKNLGVEFRFGATPRKVKIMGKFPKKLPIAMYVGEGIVFIRMPIIEDKEYMDIVLLHEIGHAILDNLEIVPKYITEENMANAISLAFAALWTLPIPNEIHYNYCEMARLPKRKNKK